MQYQKTIFGTEEEVKPKCDLQVRFTELVVALSEDTSRPVYIPKQEGEGVWYMSIDGNAYAKAPGTLMGLTGDWDVISSGKDYHLTAGLVTEAFTGMVGTALMNGACLMVEGATKDSVTFSVFGALSRPSRPVTVYRENNQWIRRERK